MPSPTAPGLWARLLDRIARRLAAPQTEVTHALRRDVEALRTNLRGIDRKLEDLAVVRKQLEKLLASRRESAAIAERLDRILDSNKEEDARSRHLRRQVSALVRAQYFPADVPAPHGLLSRRFHLRAQNEEDGIILALLEETGVASRRFVEIGSGNTGGNSAVLAHDMGWSGVMIDIRSEAIDRLREELRFNAGVTVLCAKVDASGIDALLREHGMSGEIDLLSIDVDSVDYWIFEAIEVCTPRIVVLEYNAHFGPERAVTLPNADRPTGAPKYYFGASLAALTGLARRKGYDLVLCEPEGVNAFFVRDGLAPSLARLTPAEAYRPQHRRTRDRGTAPAPEQVFSLIAQAGLPLLEV